MKHFLFSSLKMGYLTRDWTDSTVIYVTDFHVSGLEIQELNSALLRETERKGKKLNKVPWNSEYTF